MKTDFDNETPTDRTAFDRLRPAELRDREDLTRDQKVEMLHQWELDLRERMVAEEENMGESEPASFTLDEVLDALRALGAESRFHQVPTMHG